MNPAAGSKKAALRNNATGYLFAAPAILGFLIFTIGPMIASLVFSFTDYSVTGGADFIGLDNYSRMFGGQDPYFYKSLWVTTYYVLLSVPMQIVYAFLLAILLNQNVRGMSTWRTIFYLPSIVPAVALSMIWLWILDPDLGLANELLRMTGLPTSQWIYAEETVIPTLAGMSMWSTGGTTIIFLASLKNISKQMYEAVDIDGGSSWHKFRHITLPTMTPIIFYNVIMALIGSFQVFSQAYIMTNGGPNNSSLFYVFYLYREAFEFSRLGSSSAIAWVLFIIIMAATALIFKSSNSWVHYENK
ncbi:carbohydrate ABC transporter permease [Cohnella cellulosilytica]|uniref:Carbohydrate ABC transporter permease n=1 Tax=Cohnella cellulosilytica TaxID=986710 RepID=A0ABW2F4P9_9BACL